MSYRSMENTIRQIMALSPRPAWTAAQSIDEQNYVAESHFKVGDEVECIESGMEGEVIKIDPEQKGKYYTVKREDGKVMKYAPDELRAADEDEEDDDEEEMEEQAGMFDYPDTSDTGGAEEVRMAKRQLHFIKYAAEEIMEYMDMVDDMDEWFQNKMANVHNMIKGLHAYIEGDKRARGLVGEEALQEKSVSQAQQKAAGAALAAKRGEIKPSELQGASKQMYDSMTTKELDDFASTKHKGLPVRKESVELDEANVKKGDSVKIINAKKYDALSKPEVSGIVIGMLGSKVMVKVGSGQMNVDAKDLVKESVELEEATDFRAGDTVYQVGSKLKGTVLHKGNQDKIVVKFGSISKMIPANQLRLAESELAVTRRADVGVEKTRTPDGKFIFKRKPKKEISVESYDRFSSVLSRAIKKKS